MEIDAGGASWFKEDSEVRQVYKGITADLGSGTNFLRKLHQEMNDGKPGCWLWWQEVLVINAGTLDRVRTRFPKVAAKVFYNISQMLSGRPRQTSQGLAGSFQGSQPADEQMEL